MKREHNLHRHWGRAERQAGLCWDAESLHLQQASLACLLARLVSTRLTAEPRQEGGRALTFRISSKQSFPRWHHKRRWSCCPESEVPKLIHTRGNPMSSAVNRGPRSGKWGQCRGIPDPSPPKGLATNWESR